MVGCAGIKDGPDNALRRRACCLLLPMLHQDVAEDQVEARTVEGDDQVRKGEKGKEKEIEGN